MNLGPVGVGTSDICSPCIAPGLRHIRREGLSRYVAARMLRPAAVQCRLLGQKSLLHQLCCCSLCLQCVHTEAVGLKSARCYMRRSAASCLTSTALRSSGPVRLLCPFFPDLDISA